jgi:ribonucleoside-diphosphate reductase alpha chain
MSTILKTQKEGLIKRKKEKTYTYEHVLETSISYFNGDELAATTWMNKYAVKLDSGEFLERSPNDMHKRMAKELEELKRNIN